MLNIVDDTYSEVVHYDPQIEFGDISITLTTEEGVYDQINRLLGTSCELEFDKIRVDEDREMKFDYLLRNETEWVCFNCQKNNSQEDIQCRHCVSFRPLETFPNILHSPELVTENELEALAVRREMERDIICEKDDLKSVSNDEK